MKSTKKIKKDDEPLRVAAIDIGTNSTRYMIIEKMLDGGLRIVEQGGEITRLGRDLHKTGKLQKPAKKETLDAVKKFLKRIQLKETDRLQLFGTSATRDAKNVREFASAVKKVAKQPLEILTGIEEGELAYHGMINSFRGKLSRPITLDIGGGSTEIAYEDDTTGRLRRVSLNIGAVRLFEAMEKNLLQALEECRRAITKDVPFEALRHRPWVGAGGTITTVAAIDLQLKKYDPLAVHGYLLGIRKIEDWFLKLREMKLKDRKKVPGLEPKRADIIVAGIAILITLLHLARATHIYVSDRGILFGACLGLLESQTK